MIFAGNPGAGEIKITYYRYKYIYIYSFLVTCGFPMSASQFAETENYGIHTTTESETMT